MQKRKSIIIGKGTSRMLRRNFTLSTLRELRICADFVCAQTFSCIRMHRHPIQKRDERKTFNDSNVKYTAKKFGSNT